MDQELGNERGITNGYAGGRDWYSADVPAPNKTTETTRNKQTDRQRASPLGKGQIRQ